MEVREEGWDVAMPPIGVMVEVPAAVYQARHLRGAWTFSSVGCNDLTQYLLAVDRNNARVAVAVSRFPSGRAEALRKVAHAAHGEGKSVSICGELAGDPGAALLLVAMGFDMLSMSATNLARVKSTLRRFSRAQADALLREVGSLDHARAIRDRVDAELQREGIAFRAR